MLQTTSMRNGYTGNGAVSSYDYDYKIFDESHLRVVVLDTDMAPTVLTINTDYTVDNVGEEDGGDIDLVNSAQSWLTLSGKLKAGYKIIILRYVPVKQTFDFANQTNFYPETHEQSFDYDVMIMQQLLDYSARSMKISETVDPEDFDTELPADAGENPNCVLIINATGDGFDVGPSIDLIQDAIDAADAAAASALAAANSASSASASASAAANSAIAAEGYAEDAEASAELAASFVPVWNKYDVTDGQAATNLTGETVNGALFSSANYEFEVIRGTTVHANGWLSVQRANGIWRCETGPYQGDLHGVTVDFEDSSTEVAQLRAALDIGAGNGTLKLRRILVPI